MISKQQVKFINSLKYNKYRLKYDCFLIEGMHIVKEFINSNFKIQSIFSTTELTSSYEGDVNLISYKELQRISCLDNPSSILAIVKRPKYIFKGKDIEAQNRIILLDEISDPGNMGSIIRTADWYGVRSIYISNTSVDVFNPKVIQATMGSLTRVKVYRVSLEKVLCEIKNQNIPCYGATLSGENLYDLEKPSRCALIFGNESHGINPVLSPFLDKQIIVPPKHKKIDSLNVAVAFGIILSEFR